MIQSAGHGLCLVGWQVGRGEDREVRFIPREKPDRDGRGTSVRRGKFPHAGGVAMEGSHGALPGDGDVTDSSLDLSWRPGSATSRLGSPGDKALPSSVPQCLL